jgi:hypothetical protein
LVPTFASLYYDGVDRRSGFAPFRARTKSERKIWLFFTDAHLGLSDLSAIALACGFSEEAVCKEISAMRFMSLARIIAIQLALLAVASQFAWSQNACDLNKDGKVDAADAQLATNMSLGVVPCTAAINGSGVCNVVTRQRVVNAALGHPCVVDGAAIPRSLSIKWTASTSSSVTYNVYRGSASGGPYEKLNSAPVTGTTFSDATAQSGQRYFYVATAVSGSIESLHSNEAQILVP